MKLVMVIPTYWGRESSEGCRETDQIYDHPTPLDQEGTLRRAIESVGNLGERDFKLLVIAAATAEDIQEKVEEKVREIVKSSHVDVEKIFFSYSHLENLHKLFQNEGMEDFIDLTSLKGYSNIRNLCILIPHILGADAAILIDDDEVFEDPEFISKAREFIGRSYEGRIVHAVAGYYLQPYGGYLVKKSFRPWMRYWNQVEAMNETLRMLIESGPRLKPTPMALGGNLIIHRSLFTEVPFDPYITRGEDIDYVINSRIFGFNVFFDNQLSIRHLPPPSPHPVWKRLRQDIYRFIYEREKIKTIEKVRGVNPIKPEELDPYPGIFLREDLEEKIYQSSLALSLDYLVEGDIESAREALENIVLAETDAKPRFNPFKHLLELRRQWKNLIDFTSRKSIQLEVRELLEMVN